VRLALGRAFVYLGLILLVGLGELHQPRGLERLRCRDERLPARACVRVRACIHVCQGVCVGMSACVCAGIRRSVRASCVRTSQSASAPALQSPFAPPRTKLRAGPAAFRPLQPAPAPRRSRFAQSPRRAPAAWRRTRFGAKPTCAGRCAASWRRPTAPAGASRSSGRLCGGLTPFCFPLRPSIQLHCLLIVHF